LRRPRARSRITPPAGRTRTLPAPDHVPSPEVQLKKDLDALMQARDLDALIVIGADGTAEVNAAFRWFVGGAHLTGLVLKKRGEPPLLLHSDLERDAAHATGLACIPSSRWPLKEIFQAATSPRAARVELYRRVLSDLGVSGRVALAGVDEVGTAFSFWSRVREAVPGLEIVDEGDLTLVQAARLTKGADEIAALEDVARRACAVVDEVRALLERSRSSGDALHHEGAPLTIGRLRAFASERAHGRGLESPGGFILSANRDAAVPHTQGDDAHVLRRGDVLLFDYFPRAENGWHHDITRTWSLGPPRPEVRRALDDVAGCFEDALRRVRPGVSTRELQAASCEFFETRGWPTVRQDPRAVRGYVHSLGHGLGLEVHERPNFPTFRAGDEIALEPGMVVTIEPGLYDPDADWGVRIEDTVAVTEDGARSLSTSPRDTEIRLAGPRLERRVRAG
jgi:Xaa-Pro aminopeptidase